MGRGARARRESSYCVFIITLTPLNRPDYIKFGSRATWMRNESSSVSVLVFDTERDGNQQTEQHWQFSAEILPGNNVVQINKIIKPQLEANRSQPIQIQCNTIKYILNYYDKEDHIVI